MQDNTRHFRELGTKWVAITSDDMHNVRKLADRCNFSFKLLSDPGGKVARSYGALWNEEGGHNDPGVFVLLADGTLIYQGIVSGPWGRPPVDQVLKVVQGAWKKRTRESETANPPASTAS